jgi:hypothetical protein
MTCQAQINNQTMLKAYDNQACNSVLTDCDQAYKQDQRALPTHIIAGSKSVANALHRRAS